MGKGTRQRAVPISAGSCAAKDSLFQFKAGYSKRAAIQYLAIDH